MSATVAEGRATLQEPTWATWLKGVALILFGLVTIAWPGLTLITLAWLSAAYLAIAGVADVISGTTGIGRLSWWWLRILIGIGEVGLAIYLFKRPGITLAFFILLLGLFFLIRGVLELALIFNPAVPGSMKVLLAAVGVLGVIAGLFILRNPVSGGLAFTWIIGVYALIAGPLSIAIGLHEHENVI